MAHCITMIFKFEVEVWIWSYYFTKKNGLCYTLGMLCIFCSRSDLTIQWQARMLAWHHTYPQQTTHLLTHIIQTHIQTRNFRPIFLRNLHIFCTYHNFSPPFFCANNYYTILFLVVCALRWYVKSLYRHFFLEDIAKHATVTKKMAPPQWQVH